MSKCDPDKSFEKLGSRSFSNSMFLQCFLLFINWNHEANPSSPQQIFQLGLEFISLFCLIKPQNLTRKIVGQTRATKLEIKCLLLISIIIIAIF